MKTTKFSEILETLKSLDGWLVSLGIKSNTDRIHHAVEIVEKANKGWKKLRESNEPTKIGNVDDYYFGLVEPQWQSPASKGLSSVAGVSETERSSTH